MDEERSWWKIGKYISIIIIIFAFLVLLGKPAHANSIDVNVIKTYDNISHTDTFLFWFSFLLALVGLFMILYVFFGRRYTEWF